MAKTDDRPAGSKTAVRGASASPTSPEIERARAAAGAVEIGLTAAVVSVTGHEPMVLTVREGKGETASDGLPSGPFTPLDHRTLEIGLRSYVASQTGLDLGYVEQLYTFGDRGRHANPGDAGPHVVSIGYLALTGYLEPEAVELGRGERGQVALGGDSARDGPGDGPRDGPRDGSQGGSRDGLRAGISWRSWYDYFPWEDRRFGLRSAEARREILNRAIIPYLDAWAATPIEPGTPVRPIARADRVRMCFPAEGGWDEEKVLERYELLYEASLVEEARRDGRAGAVVIGSGDAVAGTGPAMRFDHRRILATAIGRLRGKIKYRPVIFELLPDEFTLYELQRTVEAILGPHLHKQNFRRLVETGGLVEPTGDVRTATGGRPARLYRFRREVLLERPAPGVRVNPGRG
ncbi:MAG: NAD regulator [Hyphomicrobium aestuarii]|nr:NAD regulator [Hyphomicrobium aestuarii]